MTDSWQEVHDAYPINQQLIWLNNCGITPPGRKIAERMRDYFEACSRHGPGADGYAPGRVLRELKSSLGRLLGCDPDEVALVHNTAEAMTMVAMGLSLQTGDEILVLEHEYPSNVYPWQYWQQRGVRLKVVPLAPTPDEFFQHFLAAIGTHTRVAAMSAVHWCTGMPLPLPELAAVCREQSIRLVVDGSQGVGQVPLDMRALGSCIVAFSGWKWLLGPLGVGVLALTRDQLHSLTPVFKGPDAMAGASYLPYQTAFKPTADRYTYSTANLNDWVYFATSLKLLEELGFERVRARIHQLTSDLWRGLAGHGFRSAYQHSDTLRSGILAVEREDVDARKLADALAERGIVARERLGRLRLAPHVYLLEHQLTGVVESIAELTARASP